MSITLNGTPVKTTSGAQTSLSVTLPAGVLNNDVIIVSIGSTTTTITITPPTGYAIVGAQTSSSTAISGWVYKHVWLTGDPTTVSFTWGGSSVTIDGICAAYTGVDTTNPIDGNASVGNAAALTVSFPTITITSGHNADMLLMLGMQAGTQTYSSASKGTIEQNQGTGPSGVFIDALLVASGATGAQTVANTSSNRSVGYQVALLPAAVVSTDDPQYWKFWDNVSAVQQWQAVQAERVDVALALLLYMYPQTPPGPAVGSTGIQLLKTFEDFSVRRIVAFQHGTQFPQTPPPPTDNPLYWDFWNQMSARTAGDRSAALRLASLHLLQAEYPQKPPPKPDDPLYWSFWNARARTLSEEARALQTRAAIALQLSQYPFTPPPPLAAPDDPQYWDFWNQLTGRTNADRISAIARLANLEFLQSQYPQTPPPAPDNPQYWSFWNDIASTRQRATSVSSQTQASIFALYQYPQTPPPAPDNPQYWSYWTSRAYPTYQRISTAALTALLLYPQTPPPPPPVADNTQYWAYWTDATAAIIRQRAASTQVAAQAALDLAQYPQTPPPPPDNPQYWAFWNSEAVRINSELQSSRVRGVISELLTFLPAPPQPPPPPSDNPQYWAFWTDIAAMLNRQHSAASQVNITLAQLMSEYAQSPQPAPVVSAEAIVIWRIRGGF